MCFICSVTIHNVKAIETENVLRYNTDREEKDNFVTLYVDNVENMNRYYTAFICYDFKSVDGDDWYSKKTKVSFDKSGSGCWKYNLPLKKKGTYRIYIKCIANSDGGTESFKTNKITVQYDNTKPEFCLKDLEQLNIGGNTYGNYYNFFGTPKIDGNTYYYNGESIRIGAVVYEGGISINDIKCKVGGSIYSNGTITKNSGFAGTQFIVKGETEGKVFFTATNKNGISESVDTGKTIVIDHTAPDVQIDAAYNSRKQTIYKSKRISVPITITEKHFDSDNTRVFINGKGTNVSWQSSGENHIAEVKLREGVHVISAKSIDKAGNVSDEVKSAKIIIDTAAPAVRISGNVENGKSYGNRNGQYMQYSVSVRISDKNLSGNEKVMLYRINGIHKVLEKTELIGSLNGNHYDFKMDDIQRDGYYKLEISAMDKAGNKITDKSLHEQGNYKVSKGKVIGFFYINRNGSRYELDESSRQYYESSVNKVGDVVIYEYNMNHIKKENQHVTLITTLGEKNLTTDIDYTWQDISKSVNDDIYQYVYKYTISPQIFSDGLFSIKIVSEADVIGDGNNSLKVEASNDMIMNQVISFDTKKPEILFMKKDGSNILIHVRDENFNRNSVELKINGQAVKLTFKEELSTSTNYYYTCIWEGNISDVSFSCSDLADNKSTSTYIQVKEEETSITGIILLSSGALILIIGIVIIIAVIRREKQRGRRK